MGCNRLQSVRPHGPYTAPNFWSLVRLDLVAQIPTALCIAISDWMLLVVTSCT